LEFVELDGDAHLEIKAAHAITLAWVIRRVRPGIVLAPTRVEAQHPDHWRLGQIVADAARLARYGGVAELRELPPHAIGALWHYAIAPEAEPGGDASPVLIDVSAEETMRKWRAAMRAHASQSATRPYEELQLTRARAWGLRAGVGYAQALYPAEAPVFESLEALGRAARQF
jgi:LmbE family N-acetylglucosaminyl deacetylase